MTDDNNQPGGAPEGERKKGGKVRDWLVIVALIAAVALIFYFGTMDPAERYKLIRL